MEKIVKLNCNCLHISFLLLGVAVQNKQLNCLKNTDSFEINQSQVVTCFVRDNFETFVSKYNEYSGDNWDATHIEKTRKIIIEDSGNIFNGMFIDFNDNKGYMVIDKDKTIYDLKTIGESPFLNIETKSIKYSTSYGYSYLCGGKFLSAVSQDVNCGEDSDLLFSDKHYDGQDEESKGCGNIINPNAYVKDKYGDGWSLENSNSLSVVGSSQYDLSCYHENVIIEDKATGKEKAEPYSEGNCWFVSAFHILKYMRKTYWKDMPSAYSYITYTPSVDEPNLYSKYYDASGNNISKKLYFKDKITYVYQHYLAATTFSFETLYADVRRLVDSKFKKVDSGTISETCAVIERVAKQYNHTIDAEEHFNWADYVGTVAKNIDSHIPSLLSTSNDTYGNHTMAVCGYKHYSKTTGWWIFKQKETKVFFELKDGWNIDSRYYDISGHIGFGAIVTLKF